MSSSQSFLCPSCQSELKVRSDQTSGPCPFCGEIITAPREPQKQWSKSIWFSLVLIGIVAVLSLVLLLRPPSDSVEIADQDHASDLDRTAVEKVDVEKLSFEALRSFLENSKGVVAGSPLQGTDEWREYLNKLENEQRFNIENFQLFPLTEGDAKKGLAGFVLSEPPFYPLETGFRPVVTMAIHQNIEAMPFYIKGASARHIPPPSRRRVLAFFRTDQGKTMLDWPLYAQTRYQLFPLFAKGLLEQTKGTFRLGVVREKMFSHLDQADTLAVYRIHCIAYSSDSYRVSVSDPAVYQEIEKLLTNYGSNSTGTFEVVRQGRRLIISKMICAEFLGLGGREQ